ncbi:MAG: hypothetical protein U9O98_00950 [Asgard group archaeon]|nr:hypothetical protein [Asgard group archaeon]
MEEEKDNDFPEEPYNSDFTDDYEEKWEGEEFKTTSELETETIAETEEVQAEEAEEVEEEEKGKAGRILLIIFAIVLPILLVIAAIAGVLLIAFGVMSSICDTCAVECCDNCAESCSNSCNNACNCEESCNTCCQNACEGACENACNNACSGCSCSSQGSVISDISSESVKELTLYDRLQNSFNLLKWMIHYILNSFF